MITTQAFIMVEFKEKDLLLYPEGFAIMRFREKGFIVLR